MSRKLNPPLAQPSKSKFISEIAGIWGLIGSLLVAMQALPFLSAEGNELT
jgi:hypothetical protein